MSSLDDVRAKVRLESAKIMQRNARRRQEARIRGEKSFQDDFMDEEDKNLFDFLNNQFGEIIDVNR